MHRIETPAPRTVSITSPTARERRGLMELGTDPATPGLHPLSASAAPSEQPWGNAVPRHSHKSRKQPLRGFLFSPSLQSSQIVFYTNILLLRLLSIRRKMTKVKLCPGWPAGSGGSAQFSCPPAEESRQTPSVCMQKVSTALHSRQ